jgi:hypothetical protein
MYMRFRSDRFSAELRFAFSRVNAGLSTERVRLVRCNVLWAESNDEQRTLDAAASAVLSRVALPRRRMPTEQTLEAMLTVLAEVTQDASWRCVNRYRVLRRRARPRRRSYVYGGTAEVGMRRHPVHEYSYKPTPRFRVGGGESDASNVAFFGVELEVDQAHHSSLDPRLVPDVAHPLFYCKRDGSLNNGVELVSHPGSEKWWNEQRGNVEAMLTRLVQMGWRSHEIGTCGMHVHLSASAFEGSMHIYRFLHLVYRYPELALLVSQRQRARMNQWATLKYNKRPSLKSKANMTLKGREWERSDNAGHYDGVNQTSATYELRIFNGTMNPKRFYKNLQYAWAALAFTAETFNLRHVTAARFVAWVNERADRFPDLAAFFAEHAGHAALAQKRVERAEAA